jgi:hypothetical protein
MKTFRHNLPSTAAVCAIGEAAEKQEGLEFSASKRVEGVALIIATTEN